MRAFIDYVLICDFLLGCFQTEGKYVQFLCGYSLILYNPKDEECINGKVFRKTTTSAPTQASTSPNRFLCGGNLQLYNPVSQLCINGHVFERIAPNKISTSPNSLFMDRKHIATPEQKLSSRCCDSDVSECGSSSTKCQQSPPRSQGYTVSPVFSLISLVTGLPDLFYRILK